MTRPPSNHRARSTLALCRIGAGLGVLAVLAWTCALAIRAGEANPFDFFGYFTNQTSLLTAALLIATGLLSLRAAEPPGWIGTARAMATAYLLVVGVIYNLLVPATGSAPPWVSTVLHIVFPVLVVADWLLHDDRPRLAWSGLWILLPYPLVWITVVLIRGATNGWVPYGFLMLAHGLPSLVGHLIGLLAAILGAGALIWAVSRRPGLLGRARA